jgi:hypothetical protein
MIETREAIKVAVVVHRASVFVEFAVLQRNERTADHAGDLP